MSPAVEDNYLRQAEECRRQAEKCVRDSDRDAWLKMAEEWERLAHDARPPVRMDGAVIRFAKNSNGSPDNIA